MVNQLDIKFAAAAKLFPVTVTEPPEPDRTTCWTRPPSSPRPLRWVTTMLLSVPTWGYAASMLDTGTDTVQSWFGLQAPATHTESPASGTAGNWAPVEYPPEEAEYSVVATVLVPFTTMTSFTV